MNNIFMMRERFTILVDATTDEQSKHRDFEELTGLKRNTVKNLLDGKQRFNEEHIEVVSAAFPAYKYWLVFGEESPKIGQFSPMSKPYGKTK